MNRKLSIFVLTAGLLLALAIWWRLNETKPTNIPAADVPSRSTIHPSGRAVDLPRVRTTTNPLATGPRNPSVTDDVLEFVRQAKKDPTYEWRQPINFYGRVVDEHNIAVIGASVHFVWNDLSPEGTSEANAISDDNGYFSLTNRRGKAMSVSVSKNGYYTYPSEIKLSFEYANPADGLFRPDPMNPVVFHLRKRGEGAELIHGSQLFGFHTNGPVQYLDLLNSKNSFAPPGDLIVQFTRSPRNGDAKFDWSVVISAPDGGVLESDDEFMFEGPTNSYMQSIEILETTNDPHWTASGKERFYFTSRHGSIYGRAEATIYPQYQTGAAIDLDYYINPSGSRNLEPKE